MSRVCLDCAHDPCRPLPRPAHAGGHAADAAQGRVARPPVRHGASRDPGAPLPASEIESFYTRSEKPVGVLRVLRALDAQLVRCADDLYQITLEYLQDAAAHNVHHAEFFWNPTGTVHASCIAYPMAQAAIVRAIRDAQQDFGITGRLIAAIDREASPEAAVEMVGWVNANRCYQVISIPIHYPQNQPPPHN